LQSIEKKISSASKEKHIGKIIFWLKGAGVQWGTASAGEICFFEQRFKRTK